VGTAVQEFLDGLWIGDIAARHKFHETWMGLLLFLKKSGRRRLTNQTLDGDLSVEQLIHGPPSQIASAAHNGNFLGRAVVVVARKCGCLFIAHCCRCDYEGKKEQCNPGKRM
jgi:hypothetical protein